MQLDQTLQRVAFITPQRIGEGALLQNGWHVQGKRRTLILQSNFGPVCGPNKDELETRRTLLPNHLDLLRSQVRQLDMLVMHIDAWRTSQLADVALQLPASKLIFLSCFCGDAQKRRQFERLHLPLAVSYFCECGAQRSMEQLLRSYMPIDRLQTLAFAALPSPPRHAFAGIFVFWIKF